MFNLRKKFIYYFPAQYCSQENVTSFTDMNLEYNHIDKLPDTFNNFSSLQVINLGHNDFIKIPRSLCNLHNIEAIGLHNNKLIYLPDEICHWKKIKCLNLSHNQYLTHLPESCRNWKNIKYLNLNHNRLLYLYYVESWTQLEILKLANNSIRFIDQDISQCLSLTEIDLKHNKLEKIDGIGELFNLKKLNISHNNIKNIALNSLMSIEELNLSNNSINNLEDIDWSVMSHLTSLDLSNNNIDNLDDIDWTQLNNLTNLKLDGNNLTHFPVAITQLPNLTSLSISNNNISTIPDEIGNLNTISLLDISHNQITELPDEMRNMTSLEELYVNNNRIQEIPDILMECPNLGFCDYAGNDNVIISQELIAYLNRTIQNNLNGNPIQNVYNLVNGPKVTIYNDSQSVHSSSIQSDIRQSITKIMKDNSILDVHQVLILVKRDDVLDDKTKKLLIRFSKDLTNHHTTLGITFGDLLAGVWEKIISLKPEYQIEVKKIMCEEMELSDGKCFTGKISRLVSCLHGFIKGVEIGISKSEQISNIITMTRQRLINKSELTTKKWKEEFIKEMKDRKYSEKDIEEWSEHIEV